MGDTMTKRTSAAEVIASTFGMDISEAREARYQTYTAPAVYSFGGPYYAVYKTKPRHAVGGPWRLCTDQFWATKAGSALWVSDVE